MVIIKVDVGGNACVALLLLGWRLGDVLRMQRIYNACMEFSLGCIHEFIKLSVKKKIEPIEA